LRLCRHLGKLDPAANTCIAKAAPELEHDPASDSLPVGGSAAEKATGGNCEERSPTPSAPAQPRRHHLLQPMLVLKNPAFGSAATRAPAAGSRFAQSVRSGS
jgi:hypothetical protein